MKIESEVADGGTQGRKKRISQVVIRFYRTVGAVIESNDGALWFGTWGGVSCFYNGIWTGYTTTSGLADNEVTIIIESSDGALWFGTGGKGVSRFHQGVWITLTTADGLADNNVSTIIEASDGNLWFGTSEGVSRLRPDKISPFTLITEGPEN